jgi:hypothetical protein
VPVGSSTLRRAQRGDLAAADLRIPLAEAPGPELDLAVEDGDNPPLELTGVKAELEPLPWIYFEAPAAGALTARYGDPRQAPGGRPPRYDLEAVRDGLGKIRPAAARWGEMENRELPPVEAETGKRELPTTGAPLDVSAFRHSRPVPAPGAAKKGGAPVLASLLLDAAVLAGSPGLSDLRLADGQGRQIPYLVDRRSERLALDLAPLAATKGEGGGRGERSETRYAVALPETNLPEARLVLSTSARVFERQVRLIRLTKSERASRRNGRIGEATVAEATWRHADPETAPPQLVLDVPPTGADELELRIDEGDNAPLPLLPPRLLLPAIRIRYFHPSLADTAGAQGREQGVRLLYGQPGLGAPRYDLALLAPRLLGSAAEEVELAPEKGGGAGGETDPLLPRWAFWGVLALAVAVLLAVLARLLR